MNENNLKKLLEDTKVRNSKSEGANGTVEHEFSDGNGLGVFDKDAIDGSYSKGWDNLIPAVGAMYTSLVERIKRNKGL